VSVCVTVCNCERACVTVIVGLRVCCVQRSMRVLDGGVALYDAVSGVEAQSETVWQQVGHRCASPHHALQLRWRRSVCSPPHPVLPCPLCCAAEAYSYWVCPTRSCPVPLRHTQADRYGVPRIAFVNKMDRDGASLADTAASMQKRLGVVPLAIHMPSACRGFDLQKCARPLTPPLRTVPVNCAQLAKRVTSRA
jgi:hypothetical protein